MADLIIKEIVNLKAIISERMDKIMKMIDSNKIDISLTHDQVEKIIFSPPVENADIDNNELKRIEEKVIHCSNESQSNQTLFNSPSDYERLTIMSNRCKDILNKAKSSSVVSMSSTPNVLENQYKPYAETLYTAPNLPSIYGSNVNDDFDDDFDSVSMVNNNRPESKPVENESDLSKKIRDIVRKVQAKSICASSVVSLPTIYESNKIVNEESISLVDENRNIADENKVSFNYITIPQYMEPIQVQISEVHNNRNFFVHINKEEMMDFDDQFNRFYRGEFGGIVKLDSLTHEQIDKRKLYCVYDQEDDHYYRAQILKHTHMDVFWVLFVDFGILKGVLLKSIHELDPMFSDNAYPIMALNCFLNGKPF